MSVKPLDIEELNKTFRLTPAGELERYYTQLAVWKVPPQSADKKGYTTVTWKNTHYRYHRILWAVHYQEDIPPNLCIDHIDGNPANNIITNLRVVTARQNDLNRKIHRAGHIPGVYKKSINRYGARIQIGANVCYLGYYSTITKASEVYNLACSLVEEYKTREQFVTLIKELANYKPRGTIGYWQTTDGRFIVELYIRQEKVYMGIYSDEYVAKTIANLGLKNKESFETTKQYRALILSIFDSLGLDTN